MTRRAVYLLCWSLLLWAAGALLEVEAFFILSALCLAALAWGLLLLPRAGRRITVRRRLPGTVRQGEVFQVEYTLTTESTLGAEAFLLRDPNPACGEEQEEDAPRLWISGLSPARPLAFAATCTAAERGVHELETVELLVSDPLQLFRRRRRLPCPGRVTVLPRWETLTLVPLNSRQRSYLVGVERTTVEGEGQEFFGVREYRHGDSLRRIHWRSTARRGHPMVRQFENESRPNLAVFVDTAPAPGAGEAAARQALDRCAAVACSLAAHGLESGSRIACFAGDQPAPRLHHADAQVQKRQLMRYLAGLTLREEPSTAAALAAAARRLGGDETLVAVLAGLDAESTAVLSSLAYHGRQAVVFLVETAAAAPRRGRRREPAPPPRSQRVEGLRAAGTPVVPASTPGELDRAIRAWLH